MSAAKGPVLIWTGPCDVTSDHVVLALNDIDVPVVRCDTADFADQLTMSTTLDGNGWNGTITGPQGTIDLSDIRACYYRRPQPPRVPDLDDPAARALAEQEIQAGFGGALRALQCRWINHPAHIKAAADKPTQLRLATELGLSPPRTIITNDPATARAFAAELGQQVVYKTLGDTVLDDGTRVAVPTTAVTSADLDDAICTSAHTFQESIPKTADIRLTVVGPHQFAARIHTSDGRLDWRTSYNDLTITAIETPQSIRASVDQLMRHLDLTYAALDFAETPSGRWRFFEINPNGQWAFIQQANGQPIAAAIATQLATGL